MKLLNESRQECGEVQIACERRSGCECRRNLPPASVLSSRRSSDINFRGLLCSDPVTSRRLSTNSSTVAVWMAVNELGCHFLHCFVVRQLSGARRSCAIVHATPGLVTELFLFVFFVLPFVVVFHFATVVSWVLVPCRRFGWFSCCSCFVVRVVVSFVLLCRFVLCCCFRCLFSFFFFYVFNKLVFVCYVVP